MARSRVWSFRAGLLAKSREAALTAVQTFNNPLTKFKSETFIVLMVIAWTYLLHAYYRSQGVDYRYFDQGPKRRRFHRTKSGEFKHWELERCLNEKKCPLNPDTKSNLRFLIGPRHEIEHHRSAGIDDYLTGRYLASCLNYERVMNDLFGSRYSVGSEMAFALQFRDLTTVAEPTEAMNPLPAKVARYIQEFDTSLPADEFQSAHFSYRLLFTPKLTGKPGQADRVIEFISPESSLAETIDKEHWVVKLEERPKYLPSQIVALMHDEGYLGFSMHHHTVLWKILKGKEPGKGYGAQVANDAWYWYERWIDEVRKHCAARQGFYGFASARDGAPVAHGGRAGGPGAVEPV